jgi:hypothetical protein
MGANPEKSKEFTACHVGARDMQKGNSSMIREHSIGRRVPKRRGVLLLVVLSLLVLFVLAGMTFMVVAGQYRRSSIPMLQEERTGDPPKQQLETAMYELLRDTSNANSMLRDHSLLMDKYGRTGIIATINTAPTSIKDSKIPATNFSVAGPNDNSVADLSVDTNDLHAIDVAPLNPVANPSLFVRGALIGHELTPITGRARGGTTRIVAYWPNRSGLTVGSAPGNYPASGFDRIFILPIQSDSGADIPAPGDRCLINDLPFNGVGSGYNAGEAYIDPTTSMATSLAVPVGTRGIVLHPELFPTPQAAWTFGSALDESMMSLKVPLASAFWINHPFLANITATSALPGGKSFYQIVKEQGGLDEPYDAADYENLFLACTLTESSGSRLTRLPSFHRPDLVRYIADKLTTANPSLLTTEPTRFGLDHPDLAPGTTLSEVKNVLRSVILRPLRFDHPNFTGSNPRVNDLVTTHPGLWFNPVDGPWDVDNDGDGEMDSVWVDLGFPAQTASNGRRYKPLFAFYVRDMDGRVNLNTSGNLAQTDAINFDSMTLEPMDFTLGEVTDPVSGGVLTAQLPRGQGYGPAEINVAEVLGTRFDPAYLRTRYGTNGTPADTTDDLPGVSAAADFRFELRHPGLTEYLVNPFSTDYLTVPDLYGRMAVYLADNGQVGLQDGAPKFYIDPTSVNLEPGVDNPYEIDPYRGDDPYSDADLENFLRFADHDRQMLSRSTASWRIPDPLVLATGSAPLIPSLQQLLTTRSYDVPALPSNQVGSLPTASVVVPNISRTIRELFVDRMALVGLTPAAIEAGLSAMLPWEVLKGERMDVNRPWGNGRDEDASVEPGNSTVDDFGDDVAGPETYLTRPQNTLVYPAKNKDLIVPGFYDNIGPGMAGFGPGRSLRARQAYAKHLYCLMMFLMDSGYTFPLTATLPTGMTAEELTAKRIAQWAINVVDARDADLTMTPFEYDLNPWDGWDVNDDFTDDDGPNRRVAWGVETPTLVMTETMAFHDRRVKDTSVGGTLAGPPVDAELDQPRIPQGSLFLELLCPSSVLQMSPEASPDLFVFNAALNQWELDLDKLAPPDPGGIEPAQPVWRIAISRPFADLVIQYPDYVEPMLRDSTANSSTTPDAAAFQPLPGEIERLVWFTSAPFGTPITLDPTRNPELYVPTGTTSFNNIFVSRDDTTFSTAYSKDLAPGRYAVIGPRKVTYFGEGDSGGMAEISDQRIEINTLAHPRSVGIYDLSDTLVDRKLALVGPNATPTNPLGIVVKAEAPALWANNSTFPFDERGIGLNVSEPLVGASYYPEPDMVTTISTSSGNTIMLRDGYSTAVDTDIPWDGILGANLTPPAKRLADYAARATGLYDLGDATLGNLRRTAYLQRLADPQRPYHYLNNPYMTVDWMRIDLSVFNGSRLPTASPPDPDDPTPGIPYVASRVRGFVDQPPTLPNNPRNILWNQQDTTSPDGYASQDVAVPPIVDLNRNAPTTFLAGAEFFQYELFSTNQSLATSDLGQQNYSLRFDVTNTTSGANQSFPWININNRPFVSELELMQVPSSSPDRLFLEFSTASAIAGVTTYTNYDQSTGAAHSFRAAGFGHLLNFFNYQLSSTGDAPANLGRIFDYLDVPSRFVGTQFDFLHTTTTTGAFADQQIGFDGYWAPLNKMSKMREPGKINLNTVMDDRIFSALMSGFPEHNTADMYDRFVRSRAGYGAIPPGPTYDPFDSEYPTMFANPFRPSQADVLLPPGHPTASLSVAGIGHYGIDATLFRQNPDAPGTPLFAPSPTLAGSHNNPVRNPYFAYAGIQRLANMTTTQSNVYAVWVTMGYFEVSPWTGSPAGSFPAGIDAAHPDGLQLGRELGEATGDIERHRAFYLIDRSIPVAFEPGQNHNVDDAVIIRRFIE